jgi:NADH-quinone oxidoreductase subunit J
MTPIQIIFLVVALVTITSAIMVVSLKNLFHAALWLIMTLMGVAIIFALLEASIFAIMLTRNIMSEEEMQINRAWGFVLLLVMIFAVVFISQISKSDIFSSIIQPLPVQGQENISAFGEQLLNPTGFALPFELSSLLLLGALVGGVYLAIDKKGGESK